MNTIRVSIYNGTNITALASESVDLVVNISNMTVRHLEDLVLKIARDAGERIEKEAEANDKRIMEFELREARK